MANLQKIALAVGSNRDRNARNNSELLLNMMAVSHGGLAKEKFTLLGTAGFKTFHEFTGENILGLHSVKEIVYVVTDKAFYKVEAAGVSFIGAVSFLENPKKVSIEDNGFDIVFVAGNGYYYNIASGTLSDYNADPAYYPSDTVAFLDGYFIFNRRGTMQFFISNLYSTALDAIDFASKEANPDDLIGVACINRNLWLVGRRSTEVWSNIGSSTFPFLRIAGAVHEHGTSNHKTIAKLKNSIFFLGDNGAIYMSNGLQLQRVSNTSIEYRIRKDKVSFAEAFTYSEEGNDFYCITINNLDTYVYDIKSGEWHNRSSERVRRWRIKDMVQYNITNQNIGADFTNGKLYEVDIDIPTEDGEIITRSIYSVPIHNGVDYVTMNEFQIDMITGELKDPKKDAIIKIQFSDDGANTWSNIKEAKTGKLADYNKRVVFRRLGRFRERVMKIVYQEPTQLQVLGAYARFSDA